MSGQKYACINLDSTIEKYGVILILHRLVQLGWIKLNHSGAIWLTVLFEFGTVFWWLSIIGTVRLFSQVVTVLFYALAFRVIENTYHRKYSYQLLWHDFYNNRSLLIHSTSMRFCKSHNFR
jgi:hypothetical protein